MASAATTVVGDGSADSVDSVDSVLREAMLAAIGELSEAERERLGSATEPADVAQSWRDLIAERAAREREATVRTELTREFQERHGSAQPRPTQGLHGQAPTVTPGSVSAWADLIMASENEAQRERRRAQFAVWLAAHPGA